MKNIQNLLLCACCCAAYAGDLCIDEGLKLVASDQNTGALFGVHVDVDATTIVIGASDNETTVLNGGAVYVYELIGDVWTETNILESLDLDASDFVGFSVGIDGDVLVTGAWGDDEQAAHAGAAYVFERDFGGAGNWGQRQKLMAFDGASNDLYGFDVTVDGGTLAVGAPLDNAAEVDQGSVYVYEWDSGLEVWDFVVRLRAPDPVFDAQFGTAVSLDGDTLAVGAIGDSENGSFSGAVYVFGRDEGGVDNWGLVKKLLADTGGTNNQTNDQFGFEVSVDQDLILAGAIKRDLGGVFAGAAYVFGRDEGGVDNWGQVTELIPIDAHSGQWFGSSVSISGDRAVIGGQRADVPEDQAGGAYVFERDEFGIWQEVFALTNADGEAGDLFGSSVAIQNDTVVVGARMDVENEIDGGSATVFALSQDCNACVADFTGDGMVDIADVFAFLGAYNGQDLMADLTGDGLVDISDVFAFLGAYSVGCV